MHPPAPCVRSCTWADAATARFLGPTLLALTCRHRSPSVSLQDAAGARCEVPGVVPSVRPGRPKFLPSVSLLPILGDIDSIGRISQNAYRKPWSCRLCLVGFGRPCVHLGPAHGGLGGLRWASGAHLGGRASMGWLAASLLEWGAAAGPRFVRVCVWGGCLTRCSPFARSPRGSALCSAGPQLNWIFFFFLFQLPPLDAMRRWAERRSVRDIQDPGLVLFPPGQHL